VRSFGITANVRAVLRRWWSVAVLVLFATCVALKLNGSSIGLWQRALREPKPIRGLLLGESKKVRSDEWAVWTPFLLSQARQNPPFPTENPNIGAGRAPLLMSLPAAHYTMIFRPQLWGFFLLDVERGFAWFWCAKLFGLLLALGWMLRRIGIQSAAVVAFGAIAVTFSSFTQWWFSSPAMLPEMVACWAMCIGCVVVCLESTSWRRVALAAGGLVFFGSNFVLCLYPPFQVPLAWLGLVILLGIWLERRKTDRPLALRRLFVPVLAVVVALAALIPFAFDVWPTFQIVANTAYPGGRVNTGGGYTWFRLLAGPLGFFESEDRVPPEFPNISEASNFYPLCLLALGGVAVGRFRSGIRISPLLIALAIFIIAVALFCTVQLPQWLLQATLFSQVHEARALLALGIANILLSALFLDRYRGAVFGAVAAIVGGLLALGAVAYLVYAAHQRAPEFWTDGIYLALIAGANLSIITMFFWDRARRWLPLGFSALLIAGNGLVNPVMSGLGALIETDGFKAVDRLRAEDPAGKWIGYGDYLTAQLVKSTGASTFNGTKIVPDLHTMRQFDSNGAFDKVYNRYSWIVCMPHVSPEEVSFELPQPDLYIMNLPPSFPLLREQGYNYYAFSSEWTDAISYDFELVAATTGERLWIYRRVRTVPHNELGVCRRRSSGALLTGKT
jgi:hypothetical protein